MGTFGSTGSGTAVVQSISGMHNAQAASENMCSTRRTRISSRATPIASLLLALSLQLHNSSSFVISLAASKRCHHASRSASCVRTISRAAAPDSAGSDEREEAVGVDEQADGQARSPAGLTLEGVYKRLKLETQGLADGVVGLESKDTNYGVS